MAEQVDHPAHYGHGTYEVIRVLEAWMTPEEFIGGLKFNILKYMARHRQKGGAQDIAKAKFYQDYLDDFIKRTGADVGPRVAVASKATRR